MSPEAPDPRPERDAAPPTSVMLLRRIQEDGSETAWRRLTEKYQDELQNYAAAVIGPRLRHRVDPGDLLQRAFLRALPRFFRLEHVRRGTFRDLLRKTIQRLAQEEGRLKNARHQHPMADLDLDDPEALAPSKARSPSSVLALEEALQGLHEAVQALPTLYREVITAIDLEGRDLREVAGARGVNPETLRRQLNRGRARLRDAL